MIASALSLAETLASAELRKDEVGYRKILEFIPAAIYTTDSEGRITYANRAACELAGRVPELGKDKWCVAWKLYHPDGTPLPHDECPMAIALKERRPVRGAEILAERPDGRRVSVIPCPTPLLDDDGALIGAVNVLVDVDRLKQAEMAAARRADAQAALYRFTDRLYRATSQEDAIEAALDAIIAAFRCDRASVLLFDNEGIARFVGSRGLSKEYMSAVEGHCPWRKGEVDPLPIFVPDIDSANEPESIKTVVRKEGIRALGFIPLAGEDGTIGKFMTYHDGSHIFSEEERALALTIARQLGFCLEQQKTERQRDLLVAELSHRVKNTLTTVMSIARQSFSTVEGAVEARRSFEGRIQRLAVTHGRLAEANWSNVALREILEDELAPYRREDGRNVQMTGTDFWLNAKSALALGMAFHELATNAAKYGALTSKTGIVAVSWSNRGGRLHITWQESGGPEVCAPQRKGFGCLLLERALASDLGGTVELNFASTGVRCSISVPVQDLVS